MTFKVFIVSIVKRLIRPNYKRHQNLKKQLYFNVIKPCIYKKHRPYIVSRHFGRDLTNIFMKIKVFIVSTVKRLVSTNSECHQNLKEQQYFNEIRPYIY